MKRSLLTLRSAAEMRTFESVLATWPAPETDKRCVARYWGIVRRAGGDLSDLFDRRAFTRFVRGENDPDGAGATIRRCLRHLQSTDEALRGLHLPQKLQRRPSCLVVEQYLLGLAGRKHRWVRPFLDETVQRICARTAKEPSLLAPADFAESWVAEEMRNRLDARGARAREELSAPVYRFMRQQTAAAGHSAEHQLEILACLASRHRRGKPHKISLNLDLYIQHLEANGRRSADNIKKEIHAFERFVLDGHPELADADCFLDMQQLRAKHVQAYREWIGRLAQTSQNNYLSHLRGYFAWLADEFGLGTAELAEHLAGATKKVHPRPQVWTLEQMQRFWAALQASGSPRDKATFGLLMVTGCRPEELLGVKLSDWDPIKGRMCFRDCGRDGTTRERRVSVKSARVRRDLEAYLRVRPLSYDPGEDAMFLTSMGRPLSAEVLKSALLDYKERAAIAGRATLRIFRRTFATLLHQEGVPETVRMEIMGHRSIDSQLAYTHNNFRSAADRALKKMEE